MTASNQAKPFATVRAADLARDTPPLRWLADGLFLHAGVGILGGAPKTGKSFFALDLCVSVASATPYAGHYRVPTAGHVTLLCAEDPHAVIASRLLALAHSRALCLDKLPIEVIVEPVVRFPDGIDRLAATLQRSHPSLLLLDPLIRLHRADENSASEMSVILDGLRTLARTSQTAILLVHHARKSADGTTSTGAALRGSSDLAAFGDSNLYLRKLSQGPLLELRIEHRTTACPPPLRMQLDANDGPVKTACFRVADQDPHPGDQALAAKILATITAANAPLPAASLREKLGVRNQSIADALRLLLEQGRVQRSGRDGWTLATAAS